MLKRPGGKSERSAHRGGRRSNVTRGAAIVLIVLALGIVSLVPLSSLAGVSGWSFLGEAPESGTWYAAPDGTPQGKGTRESPLDLKTALSSGGPVRPGDTLWIRGGTYRGPFEAQLAGTAEQPITVRQSPGEQATIDGNPSNEPALTVRGAWTIYQGFEITSSSPTRVSAQTGSHVTDISRGAGVSVRGPHTKVVNLVVHDAADGIGIWSDAEGAEAYGNIIYHNGWKASDRNHGHGIYTQNPVPTRLVRDNIVFNQFGIGIHVYGTQAAALDYVTLEGNTVFNNGVLESSSFDRNILLGGGRPARNPTLRGNSTYYSPKLRKGGDQNAVGYIGGCTELVMEGNYFAHAGGYPVTFTNCDGTIRQNFFYGYMEETLNSRYPDNTYTIARPAGRRVEIRPNAYERGRANVVVFNWEQAPSIAIDPGEAGLTMGNEFEIRDAQDFFGKPVYRGTYRNAVVEIPMGGTTVSPVVGVSTPPHTTSEFGVFVIVPVGPERNWFMRMLYSALAFVTPSGPIAFVS